VAESDVKYSQTKMQNVADSKYHAASRLLEITEREVEAAEKLTGLEKQRVDIEAKQVERYTNQANDLEKIYNERIRLEEEGLRAIDEANAAEQKLTSERLNEADATKNAAKVKEADVTASNKTLTLTEKALDQNAMMSATQEATERAAKVAEKSGVHAALKGGLKGASKAFNVFNSDFGPGGLYGGAIINPTSIAWEPDMSETEEAKQRNMWHFESMYREAALSKLHGEKLTEQYGEISAFLQADVFEPIIGFASTVSGIVKSFATGGDMGNVYTPYTDEETKQVDEDIKKLRAKLQNTKNGYFVPSQDSEDRRLIKPATEQKLTPEAAAYMNGNNFDKESFDKAFQSQTDQFKAQLGLQKQTVDSTKQLVEEFRAFKNALKDSGNTVNLNTINSPTSFISGPASSTSFRDSMLR
jgi:hypothetical protein